MIKTEKEVIRAIYYKDVVKFFESIGLSEELARGEICCSVCGEIVTLDNFTAVASKLGRLLFCCEKESCVQSFASYLKEDSA